MTNVDQTLEPVTNSERVKHCFRSFRAHCKPRSRRHDILMDHVMRTFPFHRSSPPSSHERLRGNGLASWPRCPAIQMHSHPSKENHPGSTNGKQSSPAATPVQGAPCHGIKHDKKELRSSHGFAGLGLHVHVPSLPWWRCSLTVFSHFWETTCKTLAPPTRTELTHGSEPRKLAALSPDVSCLLQ